LFGGLALLLAIVCSNNVLAHPGATGPDGCHLNYSNGNYHCHERKTPDPRSVIKHSSIAQQGSRNRDQGNGYLEFTSMLLRKRIHLSQLW
jgi:hypothetical protein